MRLPFTKLIASFLLGIFLVFLIPKELVHELCWHHDTKESDCPVGTNAITSHHIHCLFLTYEASLYNLESAIACPKSLVLHFAFAKTTTEKSVVVFASFPSLRGPPLS